MKPLHTILAEYTQWLSGEDALIAHALEGYEPEDLAAEYMSRETVE